ncbi:MAG: pyruvate kinase [Chloroflexi bacterium]|nr:pyruvate kinase [Chloroflexota bacterium]
MLSSQGMTIFPRHTKIVATLGPSLAPDDHLRQAIAAGVDVFRLNFSHATHEELEQTVPRIRKISAEVGRTVALLQDIQGPRLRTGVVENGDGIRLTPGETVRVVQDDVPTTEGSVSIPYPRLVNDVSAGDRILIADGNLVLRVAEVSGDSMRASVVAGGVLTSHKGVNLPDSSVTADPITEKDRKDLAYGAFIGVDYVAMSFVRSGDDVRSCRELLRKMGTAPPIISKIEHPMAIEHLADIIEESDGIMVARGDLGVEVSPERVPLLQKHIISMANEAGKPVITATQMLGSMLDSPMPTRAEASDIANAILDGTDAVMLSEETAIGQYPVEAIATMGRIALQAETAETPFHVKHPHDESHAMAQAARFVAQSLHAAALVVFTQSGHTAKAISHLRPKAPIYAFTPDPGVCNGLALWYGVRPIRADLPDRTENRVVQALSTLRERGAVMTGDRVVVFGATRIGAGGIPNDINVRTVGDP